MNTVNGPFDAYGNGTGVADGVLEVWVDGVNVLTRTDIMYRKNPAIAIDEVWLDHYHGGTHLPEDKHAFAMTAVVVARRYIGPIELPPPMPPPLPTGGVLAVVSRPIRFVGRGQPCGVGDRVRARLSMISRGGFTTLTGARTAAWCSTAVGIPPRTTTAW